MKEGEKKRNCEITFGPLVVTSHLVVHSFPPSSKKHSPGKTDDAVRYTHINTFTSVCCRDVLVRACVCVCVCERAVVQGHNVGLGVCRLTGTFTLSTALKRAASFSIWLTEIHTHTHTKTDGNVDHLARVVQWQSEAGAEQ